MVAARVDLSMREKRIVTMRMGRESLVGAKTRLWASELTRSGGDSVSLWTRPVV
jgi:hypothetical protein